MFLDQLVEGLGRRLCDEVAVDLVVARVDRRGAVLAERSGRIGRAGPERHRLDLGPLEVARLVRISRAVESTLPL